MSKKVNCIIVDDEPLAIEVIESHLNGIGGFEIIAKCSNALDAYQVLQQKNIDLIFLDIQMPEISGINFIKSLKNPPKVIITTAFRDYAVDGYELDVVDYLLKPIRKERILKAVDKFNSQRKDPDINLTDIAKVKEANPFIYLKSERKTLKIFLTDIIFIEGMKDYVIVHTRSSKIITKDQIKDLEEKLRDSDFIRVHKSFIVSLEKLTSFNSRSIEIEKKEIPIGRNYKNEVLKRLMAPQA
jgi:DNA-binding LytR/AlgR family response regulator